MKIGEVKPVPVQVPKRVIEKADRPKPIPVKLPEKVKQKENVT